MLSSLLPFSPPFRLFFLLAWLCLSYRPRLPAALDPTLGCVCVCVSFGFPATQTRPCRFLFLLLIFYVSLLLLALRCCFIRSFEILCQAVVPCFCLFAYMHGRREGPAYLSSCQCMCAAVGGVCVSVHWQKQVKKCHFIDKKKLSFKDSRLFAISESKDHLIYAHHD